MPEGITMFLYILALSFLLVNKVNSQCSSSTLNLTVGMTAVEISSPGYPNGYANNVTCGWNLTMEGPTEFAMFALHFTEISLNCTNDTLTVNGVAVCSNSPNELMLVEKLAAAITFASSRFGQTLKGFRMYIVKAYSYERNEFQCYENQNATYEVKYFSTLMMKTSCYVVFRSTINTIVAIEIFALDLRGDMLLSVNTTKPGTTAASTSSIAPTTTPEICAEIENMSPLSDNVQEVTKGTTPLSPNDQNKLEPGDAEELPVSPSDVLTVVLQTPKEVNKIQVTETTNVKTVKVTVKDKDGNTLFIDEVAPGEIIEVPTEIAGSISFEFLPLNPAEPMSVGGISAEVCVKPATTLVTTAASTSSIAQTTTPEVCAEIENMSPVSDNVQEVTKGTTPLSINDQSKLQPGDAEELPVSPSDVLTIVLQTPKEVNKIQVTETTNVKTVKVTVKDKDGNTIFFDDGGPPGEVIEVPNEIAGSISFEFVPENPAEPMSVGGISAEVCVKPDGERWLRFQNITSLEQRYIYSSKGGDAVINYKYYPGMGKGFFLSYRLVDEIPETSTVDQQTLQFSTGDTQPKLSTVDQQTLQFTTGDTQPKLSTVDQQTLQFSSGDAQPELSTVIMDQQTLQFSTGGVMSNQLVTLVVPLNFLEGYVGLQQSFGSIFVCSQLCKQIKSCKSINYAKTKQICHINNQRSNTTNAMKRVPGFIYKDVTDMHEALARSCRTNPCSLSEMCVPGPNNEIKCIPLANIGYSTKPNKCQEIECISINGGYNEYNITDVGNGRVVSMTEVAYSTFCGVSDGNVYYGWKKSSVFVDGGCSGTFKVCFTLV